MSKLASLAKQRAAIKRSQPSTVSTDESLPDQKKTQLSSIGLLDKLQKKPDTEQSSQKSRPLSKLASKSRNYKITPDSPVLPLHRPPQKSASAPKPAPPAVSAQDVFPEVDFNYPYDDSISLEPPKKSAFTSLICHQTALDASNTLSLNYIYPPSTQTMIFSAFSKPSPDDIVLEAQKQAKGFEDDSVQNGLAKMKISESQSPFNTFQDEFSSGKNSINFFVIGK